MTNPAQNGDQASIPPIAKQGDILQPSADKAGEVVADALPKGVKRQSSQVLNQGFVVVPKENDRKHEDLNLSSDEDFGFRPGSSSENESDGAKQEEEPKPNPEPVPVLHPPARQPPVEPELKKDYVKISFVVVIAVTGPLTLIGIFAATNVLPPAIFGGVIGSSVVATASGTCVVIGTVVIFIRANDIPLVEDKP